MTLQGTEFVYTNVARGAWHKVSNFVGKMSKVICDLAHFVFGVVSVPT